MGADCAALPSDSLLQVECEYIKKRLAAPRALPAQVLAAPESPQVIGTRSRPRAVEEAPPLRRQGAEPLMTIFLVSGSTIRADRTWVRGDRLFYISRDVGGSVALNDVSRVEDLMAKLRTPDKR
jgi:hypothetical protein